VHTANSLLWLRGLLLRGCRHGGVDDLGGEGRDAVESGSEVMERWVRRRDPEMMFFAKGT